MSKIKARKKVIFVVNDDINADELAEQISRMSYTPIRAGSIAEARELINKYRTYAAIFVRTVPLEPDRATTDNAGFDFLEELIEQKSSIKLGYYASRLDEEYELIRKRCFHINSTNDKTLKKGLQKLLS